MKPILTILLITATLSLQAQTAQEYLDRGIEKHNAQDYKGAIKEYDKAVKADKEMAVAYFNRGIVKQATDDIRGALADLDKTIALDDQFTKAYYSRATVHVSQERYKEAMPDLDKLIQLDEQFPNALTLRGQLRFAMQDKEGACADFTKAKANGDPAGEGYLVKFCGAEPKGRESLMLHWPEEEKWKAANTQENEEMMMIELVREHETLENWTEIGTMQAIKGVTGVPMDKAMDLMYQEAKKACPKAKLTFIEKDESVEFPWVLFTIECASHTSDGAAESQLWYIVQGGTALYTNFRAVKEAKIPADLQQKWIGFFKGGKVVYGEGE